MATDLKWQKWFFVALCLALGACDGSSEGEGAEVEGQTQATSAPGSAAAQSPDSPKAAAEGEAPQEAAAAANGEPHPGLLDPSKAQERAPDSFVVRLKTTEGDVLVDMHRDWAPLGVDRFYNLVKAGYFTDVAFFRVISGFMAQAGIHGRPEVNKAWRGAAIKDDPVTQSNTRGMLTFATSGKDSRTTQFFINFADNARLDAMGFAPIGKVRNMEVVDKLYSGYGEVGDQFRIQTQGNAYLKSAYPELDYILSASVE